MADQDNGYVDRGNSAPLNTQASGGVAPDWQSYAILIGTVWLRKDDKPIYNGQVPAVNPSQQ